jgi:hypothetical protein
MAKSDFENLKVYQMSENLADEIWDVVLGWDRFARDTVGSQVVRAADSIGGKHSGGAWTRQFPRQSKVHKDCEGVVERNPALSTQGL